jgi:hypothetical protein
MLLCKGTTLRNMWRDEAVQEDDTREVDAERGMLLCKGMILRRGIMPRGETKLCERMTYVRG